MTSNFSKEPMLEMFIFETLQLVEQLEQTIINSEREGGLEQYINEIFRIMHTIKGSAAMMLYDNVSTLAHATEDLFFYIREEKPQNIDYTELTDLVLQVLDFIKLEVAKIQEGLPADGDITALQSLIQDTLRLYKPDVAEITCSTSVPAFYISSDQKTASPEDIDYSAVVFFDEGCEMENVRAFLIIHNLKQVATDISYYPENIMDSNSNESVELIRQEGFKIRFRTNLPVEEVRALMEKVAFVRQVILESQEIKEPAFSEPKPERKKPEIILDDFEEASLKTQEKKTGHDPDSTLKKQNMISVNVSKLDELMDLVGELVIAEAMVTQHPELIGLPLENFWKAARQLGKITHDLQDAVMSIRMVPLSMTFQRMKRLVREMSRKTGKDVSLTIIGEETEVDKNIIEHISDPLMHLIRNAIDHGIESAQERLIAGKPATGNIVLEAKNSGGDVWIVVRDDGAGLDAEKILAKARERGLLQKPENEYTEREIYNLILMPGFSTKDSITEFSGRGVGMDVVVKNIEEIGGTVLIDSIQGQGMTVTMKIPLTLAIIDGMTISVGDTRFTVPMTSIKESFRINEEDVIRDPDNNELIMVRGEAHPILRLHKIYQVDTPVTRIQDGIIMMCEYQSQKLCLFADALLGEQQVVIKPLPEYIKRVKGKVRGLAGCTLLGDGSISLILDVSGLIN